MKNVFISLAFLCTTVCLSAQSISDSLRLEIISIVPNKYGNYSVSIAMENRTKEFRYLLVYGRLVPCDSPWPCWKVSFEVEYKDGIRDTCQAAGAFFMKDLQKAPFLMPGERRTDIMPLLFKGTMHGDIYAIDTTGSYRLSDIKRIRVLNGTYFCRLPDVEDALKHIDEAYLYDKCTAASDWYYPDFK